MSETLSYWKGRAVEAGIAEKKVRNRNTRKESLFCKRMVRTIENILLKAKGKK